MASVLKSTVVEYSHHQKAQQQSRYSVDLHSSAKFLKKHNSSRVSDPLESVSKPLAFFSLSSIVLSVGRALSPGFALGAGEREPALAPSDTMGQVLQLLTGPCPCLWLYGFRMLQPSSNSQYLHFCVQAFFSEGVVRYSAWTSGRCQEINTQ